jgi:hypothetical protein
LFELMVDLQQVVNIGDTVNMTFAGVPPYDLYRMYVNSVIACPISCFSVLRYLDLWSCADHSLYYDGVEHVGPLVRICNITNVSVIRSLPRLSPQNECTTLRSRAIPGRLILPGRTPPMTVSRLIPEMECKSPPFRMTNS